MSRLTVTKIALSFIFLALAGCGGGSGGGTGTAYTGSTAQATVTTANAKALSADAYSGSQLSSSTVSGVAKEAGDNSGQSPLLQETAAILKNNVATILNTPKYSAKVAAATVQNTVNGFSGSYTYSVNYDQASGAFSGTMSFSQYMETSTSASLTGTMEFSGTMNLPGASNQDAGRLFSVMNISMNNLTCTNGSKSYSLTGSMAYSAGGGVYSASGAATTVTMSIVYIDNVSNRTYWVKDFTQTLSGRSLTSTASSLTITGTYYDPIHGYVDISTVTPLTVTNFDATPTAGQLLFTGSNGTKARLTFTSSGYTVEADTAGNGTFVAVP